MLFIASSGPASNVDFLLSYIPNSILCYYFHLSMKIPSTCENRFHENCSRQLNHTYRPPICRYTLLTMCMCSFSYRELQIIYNYTNNMCTFNLEPKLSILVDKHILLFILSYVILAFEHPKYNFLPEV